MLAFVRKYTQEFYDAAEGGLGEEARLDVAVREDLLGRHQDRLLDGFDEHILRDVLLLADRVDDRAEVDVLFHVQVLFERNRARGLALPHEVGPADPG